VLGRLAGVDVRARGSGNVGATNVARTAGLWWGIVTLLVDAAKGAMPVLVARRFGEDPAALAVVGVAAVYGHIFPVFSAFRGGKGVATAAGVFAVLSPQVLAAALLVFVLVVAASRVVSAASLAAAVTLPIAAHLWRQGGVFVWAALIIAITIILTHRDNIRRLFAGTETAFRAGRD
jgi:glycerol-3-phosphate acyltransferase PlsY